MIRAEREHHDAPDSRTDEDTKVARRCCQAHRTRAKRRDPRCHVKKHLAGRDPQDAGTPVNDEQCHRLPHPQRVGDEKVSPTGGRHDEEQRARLNDASRVEAIVQRSDGDREDQIGQPVRDHREPAERR